MKLIQKSPTLLVLHDLNTKNSLVAILLLIVGIILFVVTIFPYSEYVGTLFILIGIVLLGDMPSTNISLNKEGGKCIFSESKLFGAKHNEADITNIKNLELRATNNKYHLAFILQDSGTLEYLLGTAKPTQLSRLAGITQQAKQVSDFLNIPLQTTGMSDTKPTLIQAPTANSVEPTPKPPSQPPIILEKDTSTMVPKKPPTI